MMQKQKNNSISRYSQWGKVKQGVKNITALFTMIFSWCTPTWSIWDLKSVASPCKFFNVACNSPSWSIQHFFKWMKQVKIIWTLNERIWPLNLWTDVHHVSSLDVNGSSLPVAPPAFALIFVCSGSQLAFPRLCSSGRLTLAALETYSTTRCNDRRKHGVKRQTLL